MKTIGDRVRDIECLACKKTKSSSEFYHRSGLVDSYTSECKECMRVRSNRPHKTRETELIANAYLNKHGIPTLMGGIKNYSFVDIVAFGCIKIETKYSNLTERNGLKAFRFTMSPLQVKRGLLADFILLVCEKGTKGQTFHVFPVNHPVLYRNGKLKSAVEYVSDEDRIGTRKSTRYVLDNNLMNEYQDRLDLIWDKLHTISEGLKLVA